MLRFKKKCLWGIKTANNGNNGNLRDLSQARYAGPGSVCCSRCWHSSALLDVACKLIVFLSSFWQRFKTIINLCLPPVHKQDKSALVRDDTGVCVSSQEETAPWQGWLLQEISYQNLCYTCITCSPHHLHSTLLCSFSCKILSLESVKI